MFTQLMMSPCLTLDNKIRIPRNIACKGAP